MVWLPSPWQRRHAPVPVTLASLHLAYSYTPPCQAWYSARGRVGPQRRSWAKTGRCSHIHEPRDAQPAGSGGACVCGVLCARIGDVARPWQGLLASSSRGVLCFVGWATVLLQYSTCGLVPAAQRMLVPRKRPGRAALRWLPGLVHAVGATQTCEARVMMTRSLIMG